MAMWKAVLMRDYELTSTVLSNKWGNIFRAEEWIEFDSMVNKPNLHSVKIQKQGKTY